MAHWADLIGTVQNTLKIGFNALLDASGLTAARTYTLPDHAGTVIVGDSDLSYDPVNNLLTVPGLLMGDAVTADLLAPQDFGAARVDDDASFTFYATTEDQWTHSIRWYNGVTQVVEIEVDHFVRQFEIATVTDYSLQFRVGGSPAAIVDAATQVWDFYGHNIENIGTVFCNGLNAAGGDIDFVSGFYGTSITVDFANVDILNVAPAAGDIATPQNGDVWYNSTSGKFRARQAGSTLDLIGTGGGSPGGSSGELQYNNGGAFGGFGSWASSIMTVPGAVKAAAHITTNGTITAFTASSLNMDFAAGLGRIFAMGANSGTLGSLRVDVYSSDASLGETVCSFTATGLSVNERLQLPGNAGDVSSPANGDLWRNTTTGKLRMQEDGQSFNLRFDPRRESYHFDDFTAKPATSATVAAGTNSEWTAGVIGSSGSIAQLASTSAKNDYGVVRLSCGTASNGVTSIVRGVHANPTNIVLGLGVISRKWRFKVPTLSDATNRFAINLGFRTNWQTSSTDYIVVSYTDSTNSGKLYIASLVASVASSTFGNHTLVADTYVEVELRINAAGTSAELYVNGVLDCTHSTLPTSAAMMEGFFIAKSVGTTARTLDVDYCESYTAFTTAR